MTSSSNGTTANWVHSKQGAFYRTRLCKFLNDCPYGSRCFYAHSEDEIRPRSGMHYSAATGKARSTNRTETRIVTLRPFTPRPRIYGERGSMGSDVTDSSEVVMANIFTGSTELGESCTNPSHSDERSSLGAYTSAGCFDAESSELSVHCGEDQRAANGANIVAFSISPSQLAVLRAWYCYEQVRGLFNTLSTEELYHILKEAEPLFYSD